MAATTFVAQHAGETFTRNSKTRTYTHAVIARNLTSGNLFAYRWSSTEAAAVKGAREIRGGMEFVAVVPCAPEGEQPAEAVTEAAAEQAEEQQPAAAEAPSAEQPQQAPADVFELTATGPSATPHYTVREGFRWLTLCGNRTHVRVPDSDRRVCQQCDRARDVVSVGTHVPKRRRAAGAKGGAAHMLIPGRTHAYCGKQLGNTDATGRDCKNCQYLAHLAQQFRAAVQAQFPTVWVQLAELAHELHQAQQDARTAPRPGERPVHRFGSTFQAYNATQCRDDIEDGDVLVIEPERVTGFLVSAWPVAVTAEHGELHRLTVPAGEYKGGAYRAAAEQAEQIARELGFPLPAAVAAGELADAVAEVEAAEKIDGTWRGSWISTAPAPADGTLFDLGTPAAGDQGALFE